MDMTRDDYESMSIWELRGYARKTKMQFVPFQIQPTKAKRGMLIAYIKIMKEMIEKYKDVEIFKTPLQPKPRKIPTEIKEDKGMQLIVPKTPTPRIGDPYREVPHLKIPTYSINKDGI